MALPFPCPRNSGPALLAALALLCLARPAAAERLYRLDTRCSRNGEAPVACTVEAINAARVTLYRHQIGAERLSLRISDRPVRMELWDGKAQRWQSLKTAAARFSSNTICFNDRELCVVNPNYLNSVKQDNPYAMARRDLVKVAFGSDGRIHASCYDDGCELMLK